MLKDIVNRNLVTVSPKTKISEVAQLMLKEDVGCVLVLDRGKPQGLITDRDIVLQCVAQGLEPSRCSVDSVMTESLATVKETDGIFDCIELMKGARVRRIPVVDASGKAIGMVSFGDLLSVLSDEFYELTEGTTAAGFLRKQMKKTTRAA